MIIFNLLTLQLCIASVWNLGYGCFINSEKGRQFLLLAFGGPNCYDSAYSHVWNAIGVFMPTRFFQSSDSHVYVMQLILLCCISRHHVCFLILWLNLMVWMIFELLIENKLFQLLSSMCSWYYSVAAVLSFPAMEDEVHAGVITYNKGSKVLCFICLCLMVPV